MKFQLKQRVYSPKLQKLFTSIPKFIDYLVKFYDFSHCVHAEMLKGKKVVDWDAQKFLFANKKTDT